MKYFIIIVFTISGLVLAGFTSASSHNFSIFPTSLPDISSKINNVDVNVPNISNLLNVKDLSVDNLIKILKEVASLAIRLFIVIVQTLADILKALLPFLD